MVPVSQLGMCRDKLIPDSSKERVIQGIPVSPHREPEYGARIIVKIFLHAVTVLRDSGKWNSAYT